VTPGAEKVAESDEVEGNALRAPFSVYSGWSGWLMPPPHGGLPASSGERDLVGEHDRPGQGLRLHPTHLRFGDDRSRLTAPSQRDVD
jgi:hypothetical protein